MFSIFNYGKLPAPICLPPGRKRPPVPPALPACFTQMRHQSADLLNLNRQFTLLRSILHDLIKRFIRMIILKRPLFSITGWFSKRMFDFMDI